MIEPKPLLPGQRELIETAVEYYDEAEGGITKISLESLLAAEAYWRKLFAQSEACDGFARCKYCGVDYPFPPEKPTHFSGCAWNLAQSIEANA